MNYRGCSFFVHFEPDGLYGLKQLLLLEFVAKRVLGTDFFGGPVATVDARFARLDSDYRSTG